MSRPQPYRLDWTPAESIDQVNDRLSRIVSDADEMFQTIFEDLSASNPLSGVSNGLIAQTASGTYAGRTITAGSGISVTSGNGVSGNPTIAATGSSVTKISKALDQTITNSSTLQNDADFTLAVLANTTYLVHGYLVLSAPGTGTDWKFNWSLPAGASLFWGPEWINSVANWNPVGIASSPTALATGQIVAGSANNTHGFNFIAILAIAATAGTATLQWAQNSAGGAGVINTVKAGSTIIIH